MTASLASVVVTAESASWSSSEEAETGRSSEVNMQAPIAAAKGASSVKSAVQAWWLLFLNLKMGG